MRISPAPIIVVMVLSACSAASAAPCTLSTLTIEARKDSHTPLRIVSDFTNGVADFFEGAPYSYTSTAVEHVDAHGTRLGQMTSGNTVDVGFKGVGSCFGDRVLLHFSHADLVGTQSIPMAMTENPSYPPNLDYFRTTLVLDGRPGSEPEQRTMNGWTYIFRAQ